MKTIEVPRDFSTSSAKAQPPRLSHPAAVANSYSFLWAGQEIRRHAAGRPGRLRHAASNKFTERGMQAGDTLYIWGFMNGKLLLIARMVVDQIAPYGRIRHLLSSAPATSNYSEHAIARESTVKRFDNVVSLATIRNLKFISPSGEISSPVFRADGSPDPQTFRGVRQITPGTAALLDSLL